MPTSALLGPLLILAGALCFSTTGFVQALSPQGATPWIIGGLRMLGGGLVLLLWCAWRGHLSRQILLSAPWPLRQLLPALLALVGFQVSFFQGVLAAGVAVGTVCAIGFSPICVALLAWVFLGEKPAKIWYLSTAIAVLGLALLNWKGLGGAVNGKGLGAIVLPLAAGFCYACYYVFSKPLAQSHAPDTVMMVLCLGSGIILLPLFFIFPVGWLLSAKGVLVALHLGLVTTALAFSLTLAGLRITPAATASTLGLAEPLSAACLGLLCLNENPGMTGAVGMGLMLCSVLLLVLVPGRK